jgi:protein-disulfide isomerase-like protein with CxxC motif
MSAIVPTDMKKKTIQIRLDTDAHEILWSHKERLEKETGGEFSLSAALRDLKKRADDVDSK